MIELKDYHEISDRINSSSIDLRMKAGPVKTRIKIVDHDTGEVLQTTENKILVPGSQVTACKQFGLEQTVAFPTYNKELGLEHSLEQWNVQPYNEPITCLWCVGQSGFATSPNEVLVVSNTDRIEPKNDIIPFRYLDPDNDLDHDQRQKYFGRKVEDNGKISYYFKEFDTQPQLHVRYLDGTEVSDRMYMIDSSQIVEVYVEMKLAVTRLDLRDYFDNVLGWENAHINTVSLLTAWYDDTIIENPEATEDSQIRYKWYQDIIPFSKFNFENEDLKNLNRALDFIYQVFY